MDIFYEKYYILTSFSNCFM